MTFTFSTTRKKAFGKLLLLFYYIAQKKVPHPNIFWRMFGHGSSNVYQKMRVVHPLATRILACVQLGAFLPYFIMNLNKISLPTSQKYG
jgi:hypothetical protein